MNTSRPNDSNSEFIALQKELSKFKEDSDTKVKELLNRITQIEGINKKRDSFGAFQFKDVIFNATAGSDTEISHDLNTSDYDSVRAIPVLWQFLTVPVNPPYIYRNVAANARPWGPGYIILRCNLSNAPVRMLLITESR